MELHLLPGRVAVLLATLAFGVVWLVGLASDVPADAIALRSVIGAAAFWLVGLLAGRLIFNSVCDAIGEQLASEPEESKPRNGGRK